MLAWIAISIEVRTRPSSCMHIYFSSRHGREGGAKWAKVSSKACMQSVIENKSIWQVVGLGATLGSKHLQVNAKLVARAAEKPPVAASVWTCRACHGSNMQRTDAAGTH